VNSCAPLSEVRAVLALGYPRKPSRSRQPWPKLEPRPHHQQVDSASSWFLGLLGEISGARLRIPTKSPWGKGVYEPGGLALGRQRVRLRALLNWAVVERCATPGLRARPPPDASDICKWQRR
jgi:hypothetical protein